MTTKLLTALLLGTSILGTAGLAHAADVTLNIESWRGDDLTIWKDKLIPAFEAKNPGIKVVFAPSAPTEYDAALGAKLAALGGDLITTARSTSRLNSTKGQPRRPVDCPAWRISRRGQGRLADRRRQGELLRRWPRSSSFIYNKDAFDKLGIAIPATRDEFFAALDKIKADGTYIPMAMGTKDQWEAATMGYQNIGPNYWKGEEGRTALIKGEQKLTDADWVAPYAELAKWKPYLGDGFEAQTYPDSQNLFTLGRAAIYPPARGRSACSTRRRSSRWAPSRRRSEGRRHLLHLRPHRHRHGPECQDANADAAKKFLYWVASPDFATIYANSLPGFFSLNSSPVKMQDPLAQEFVSWRDKCKSTIRSTYQILSRGTPNLENETWVESANVINGTDTPEAAAKKLQTGLDSWYKPGSKRDGLTPGAAATHCSSLSGTSRPYCERGKAELTCPLSPPCREGQGCHRAINSASARIWNRRQRDEHSRDKRPTFAGISRFPGAGGAGLCGS
jgi:raffinose/stachyose/melibiose transport system substrate-binding protein